MGGCSNWLPYRPHWTATIISTEGWFQYNFYKCSRRLISVKFNFLLFFRIIKSFWATDNNHPVWRIVSLILIFCLMSKVCHYKIYVKSNFKFLEHFRRLKVEECKLYLPLLVNKCPEHVFWFYGSGINTNNTIVGVVKVVTAALNSQTDSFDNNVASRLSLALLISCQFYVFTFKLVCKMKIIFSCWLVLGNWFTLESWICIIILLML